MEGCCRRSSRNEGEVRILGMTEGRRSGSSGGRRGGCGGGEVERGPRVRREWSTCLQLCGGTPRLLWCRYPEATQICVAPSAAPSAARAATGEGGERERTRMYGVSVTRFYLSPVLPDTVW